MMTRSKLLLCVAVIFAVSSTVLLGVHLTSTLSPNTTNFGSSTGTYTGNVTAGLSSSSVPAQSTFRNLLDNSPVMSISGWAMVGGAWIWRGKTKSRWESLGFDSAVFNLFMKMKGAKTRLNLLDALSLPKDRMQLAQELDIDWKAVDYQITLLSKYGLVYEEQAFGKVKMYRLTTLGESLFKLIKEFNTEFDKMEQGRTQTLRQGSKKLIKFPTTGRS